MPRKRRVFRLPWTDAIRLIGEPRLRAETSSQSTWSTWHTKGVPADVALPLLLSERLSSGLPHRCEFLDFVAMIGDYQAMRRVMLALTGGPRERKRAEAILIEAQRLKKLEIDP